MNTGARAAKREVRVCARGRLSSQSSSARLAEEAVAKFAEHGKVKAGIRQRQAEQVLPIDTSLHRLGRLAISKIFAELHNGDERQAPRREAGLALQREAGGKVVVLEERTKGIPLEQVVMAFGKGGTGHPGGFFRHRF